MPAHRPLEVGARFGRLTVLAAAGYTPRTRKALSLCACECGAVVVKRNNDLLTGRVISCGCAHRERSRKFMWERAEKSNANHMSQTPLYQSWRSMMRRCYDPRVRSFARYGGRGITVCKSWHSFRAFRSWANAHGYKVGLELDRIDFDDTYRPGNCRWVDEITQANNKSNNHVVEYKGRRQTLSQWARELGVNYDKLKYRVRKGGTLDIFDKTI